MVTIVTTQLCLPLSDGQKTGKNADRKVNLSQHAKQLMEKKLQS